MTKYIFAVVCATIVIAIISIYSYVKNNEKKRLYLLMMQSFERIKHLSNNKELFDEFSKNSFFTELCSLFDRTEKIYKEDKAIYKLANYTLLESLVEWSENIALRMEVFENIIKFQNLKQKYSNNHEVVILDESLEITKNKLLDLNVFYERHLLCALRDDVVKTIETLESEQFKMEYEEERSRCQE